MSNERFFADLPALTDFVAVLDSRNYSRVPDDWVLFVADVCNSTEAIRRGLYRAVNMAGASCITAALNGCPGVALPFVFGGDGATLVVPESVASRVARELQGVAAMARTHFALELRIGRVPIRELHERGFTVEVAKYRLADPDDLAMLSGTGIMEAERWIKSPGSRHLVPTDSGAPRADVTGLSCRWEPLNSAHGEILTLLVHARGADAADGYYHGFYARLLELVGLRDGEMNPVKVDAMRVHWPPKSLGIEVRTQAGNGSWAWRIWAFVYAWMHSLAGYVVFTAGLRSPLLDPARYRASMVTHSDFRKFDGLLRMVIDAPHAKIAAILEMLDAEHRRGAIFYGTHRSPSALMTCMVFSMKRDSHVHFVDGNDGGYALAAVQLKAQTRACLSEVPHR